MPKIEGRRPIEDYNDDASDMGTVEVDQDIVLKAICDKCGWSNSVFLIDEHDQNCDHNRYHLNGRIHIRVGGSKAKERSIWFIEILIMLMLFVTKKPRQSVHWNPDDHDLGHDSVRYINMKGLERSDFAEFLEKLDSNGLAKELDAIHSRRMVAARSERIRYAREVDMRCFECNKQFVPPTDKELNEILADHYISPREFFAGEREASNVQFCTRDCHEKYLSRCGDVCILCSNAVNYDPDNDISRRGLCSKKCAKRAEFAYRCRACGKITLRPDNKPGGAKRVKEWHEDAFCTKKCLQSGQEQYSPELPAYEPSTVYTTTTCENGHEIELPVTEKPVKSFCMHCNTYFRPT